MEMTWEQKLAAIGAIGEASLRMREPGNWYVDQPGVDVVPEGKCIGISLSGATPAEAVNEHWAALTDSPDSEHVVINAHRKRGRRTVLWNGYFWADYAPEVKGEGDE